MMEGAVDGMYALKKGKEETAQTKRKLKEMNSIYDSDISYIWYFFIEPFFLLFCSC